MLLHPFSSECSTSNLSERQVTAEVDKLWQYYFPAVTGIATVQEAKSATYDELVILNRLAEKKLETEQISMANAIGLAFGGDDQD